MYHLAVLVGHLNEDLLGPYRRCWVRLMVTLRRRVLGRTNEKPAAEYLAAFEPAGDPN